MSTMMSTIMRLGKGIFPGFYLGLAVAMLAGHWPWFAMRVNNAFLIPICTLLGIGILAYRKQPAHKFWLILSEVVLIITTVGLYYNQLDAITLLPALLVKQGFGLSFLQVWQANLLLLLILLISNGMWLVDGRKNNCCTCQEEKVCAE